MNERLYNLMDWAEIEAVTYAETDNPHSLLGAQVTDEGILIQTFVPTAAAISVVCGKKRTQWNWRMRRAFCGPDSWKKDSVLYTAGDL